MSRIDALTPLQKSQLLQDLRDVIKGGLNSGCSDGEWDALVTAGEMLGLELADEEDRYE